LREEISAVSWNDHPYGYSAALMVFSLVAFIIGVFVMRYIIIYMPADYFTRNDHESPWWTDQHPALRWTLLILKNVVGWFCIVAGGLLSLPMIPGPGVLLILLGLSLVNLPGKRRMELWLVSFPAVYKKIDKLRSKHKQPPLKLPNRK
jgi:hypothetical protein